VNARLKPADLFFDRPEPPTEVGGKRWSAEADLSVGGGLCPACLPIPIRPGRVSMAPGMAALCLAMPRGSCDQPMGLMPHSICCARWFGPHSGPYVAWRPACLPIPIRPGRVSMAPNTLPFTLDGHFSENM